MHIYTTTVVMMGSGCQEKRNVICCCCYWTIGGIKPKICCHIFSVGKKKYW